MRALQGQCCSRQLRVLWSVFQVTLGSPLTSCSYPSVCQVQIGCHTDDLSHATELKRAPMVIRTCDIACQKQSISCLWGGLIYVVVPARSVLGKVPITVEGAVRAPFFRLGRFVYLGAFLLTAAHRCCYPCD